jgi:hypothetical protein
MGRPRKYPDAASRHRAFRARKAEERASWRLGHSKASTRAAKAENKLARVEKVISRLPPEPTIEDYAQAAQTMIRIILVGRSNVARRK